MFDKSDFLASLLLDKYVYDADYGDSQSRVFCSKNHHFAIDKIQLIMLSPHLDQLTLDINKIKHISTLFIYFNSPDIIDQELFKHIDTVIILNEAKTNLDLTNRKIMRLLTVDYLTQVLWTINYPLQDYTMLYVDNKLFNKLTQKDIANNIRSIDISSTNSCIVINKKNNLRSLKTILIVNNHNIFNKVTIIISDFDTLSTFNIVSFNSHVKINIIFMRVYLLFIFNNNTNSELNISSDDRLLIAKYF